jgi:hypothetical protein
MGESASSSGVPRSSSRGSPSLTSTPGGTGWRAFVASLRNVRWPPKFRPNLTEKYVYTTIIVAAGGDERVMANYFPMALKGQARGWLMTQPPDSIHSWEDLCQQFITNFQGTYPRPGEEADLHAVQRKDDESLRSYIQRFCQVCNTIPCIPAHAVVYAFRNGVRHNRMLEKIASKEPKTTAELFELADKVARKEEAWAWNSPKLPPTPSGGTEGASRSQPVLMTRAMSLRLMGPHGPRARKRPPAASRALSPLPVRVGRRKSGARCTILIGTVSPIAARSRTWPSGFGKPMRRSGKVDGRAKLPRPPPMICGRSLRRRPPPTMAMTARV